MLKKIFFLNRNKSQFPVPFIVGVGRSGNTLLRYMLDSHPKLAIPPETDFLPMLMQLPSKNVAIFYNAITHHWRWNDCHIDKKIFLSEILKIKKFDIAYGIRTFYRLYADRFNKPRWGDKTPYYLNTMNLIQDYLPEARFIHIIRDGRDAAMSIKNLWFGPNTIAEAAEFWKKSLLAARKQSKLLKFYLEVHYEDLIRYPENTLKKICDFIEIPWNKEMLSFYDRTQGRIKEVVTDFYDQNNELIASVEQRHSIHALTMKPPQISRIGRWKAEMSTEEAQLFKKIAGDALLMFGYED